MTKFMNYNINPKGHKTNDCVIRALAYASGKTWDEVFLELNEIAFKKKRPFNDKIVYEKWLTDNGFVKMKQPRKQWDNTKYLAKEIDQLISKDDIAVISMAHHLSCVVEHTIVDIWNCGNKTIGNYYIKRGL